jgi:putative addiction module component (TIGR02574 family)
MTLASVQASAMQLAPKERAELLDHLWESLQPKGVLEVEGRWAAEAESRIDGVDRGELTTVDGPAALRDLKRSLGS